MESRTKIKNRKTIVQTAKILFLEKGISETTMMDIAETCKMGRKTIYNYFENKEVLAKYIYVEVLKHLNAKGHDINVDKNKTNYEKMTYLIFDTLDHLLENREDVKYLVHYDYYFTKESNTQGLIEIMTTGRYAQVVQDLITNNDDSIDFKGLSPEIFIALIAQSLMGVVSRIIFRGDIIERETGISDKHLYDYCKILLEGTKQKQPL